MKRIFLSLVIVFGVVAMVASSTKAVFSVSKAVEGNTVSTASLNLVINTFHKPLHVTNLMPGQTTDWAWMDVMNTSPVALDYYFFFDNATATPDWTLWDNLKVELREAGSLVNGQVVQDAARCTADDSRLLYEGPVGTHYGLANNFQTRVGLPAGWAQRICQRVYLDSTVGNSVQGRSTTFDEVMYAEQAASLTGTQVPSVTPQ